MGGLRWRSRKRGVPGSHVVPPRSEKDAHGLKGRRQANKFGGQKALEPQL